MSEELQKPPVLDIDALLQPIEGDNPSGESLRYSGIYDEISEARRADDGLSQGAWKTETKVADFARVIDIAVSALTERAKDLQIAAWLTEALTAQHGFAGLRDGLKLLSGLEENFWDTLHPEIDEGDMEGRANAISWLESQAALLVLKAPITSAESYSYVDWEDSKKFDIPEDFDSLDIEIRDQIKQSIAKAEADRRATGESWRKAKGQTRRRFYEELNVAIEECSAAVSELDRINESLYDRNQVPGLSNLRTSLDTVHSQVMKLLAEKRLEEPDEIAYDESAAADDSTPGNGSASFSGGGSVQGRADALRRLGEIARFFQQTEPHSPVAYLVQRAVRWGNMPLESWLQDVIKDENVLFQLRQTLGLDSSAGPASYEAESSEPASEGW